MPAARLKDDPISIRKYDVAGCDSAVLSQFISHVGLAAEDRAELRCDDSLLLTHMAPPFRERTDKCEVQTCGSVELTVGEILQLQVFVANLGNEYEAAKLRPRSQYTIRPHAKPHVEADGTITFWRYSCAGFVVEAYDFVDIQLISADDSHFPEIGMDLINVVYPGISNRSQDALVDWGLDGTGPWRIVLAGYVLNSLNRPSDMIRSDSFVPTNGDEYFPRPAVTGNPAAGIGEPPSAAPPK